MLHGNKVIDQTTSEETLTITVAVVTRRHHQSTQLNVTLSDVTDYLCNVTCCSIAHFARNCPEIPENLEKHRDKKHPPNQTHLANLSNDIFECDVSNLYASHAFNYRIFSNRSRLQIQAALKIQAAGKMKNC